MYLKIILIAALSLFSSPLFAAEEPQAKVQGELSIHSYVSEDADLLAQEAYLEYSFSEHTAVWVSGYRTSGFSAAYVGIAHTWSTGWTAGIGAGPVRIEDVSGHAITLWALYASDEWEALLSAEHYSADNSSFYRGYVQKHAGKHSFGVYGESDFGIGPAATFAVNDRVRIRFATPVVDTHGTSILVTLLIAL